MYSTEIVYAYRMNKCIKRYYNRIITDDTRQKDNRQYQIMVILLYQYYCLAGV